MEDELKQKTENDLQKNGRRPRKKMEDDLKTKQKSKKNGRRPLKKKEEDLKHNLKKSTLIGCDIIVN